MDFISIIKFLGFIVEGILVSDALPAQLIRDGFDYWTIVFITTSFNAVHFAGVICLTVSRHWISKILKILRVKFNTQDSDNTVQKITNNYWQELIQKIRPRWFIRVQQQNGTYKYRVLHAIKTGGYAVLVMAGTVPYVSGMAAVFIGLSINLNTWRNRKWSILFGYFCIVLGSSLRMMLLTYYPIIDLIGWWKYIIK